MRAANPRPAGASTSLARRGVCSGGGGARTTDYHCNQHARALALWDPHERARVVRLLHGLAAAGVAATHCCWRRAAAAMRRLLLLGCGLLGAAAGY
eukprot:COSAG01_NODE_17651_length_1134_cov_1.068599_1_plen_96_part_00